MGFTILAAVLVIVGVLLYGIVAMLFTEGELKMTIVWSLALLIYAVLSLSLLSHLSSEGGRITQVWNRVVESHLLMQLSDTESLNGRFRGGGFLVSSFSGSISEQSYYLGYRKEGTNSFKQFKIDANMAVIITDGSEPRIDTVYNKFTCEPVWWAFLTTCAERDVLVHYNLHVPEGSIIQDFTLDGVE